MNIEANDVADAATVSCLYQGGWPYPLALAWVWMRRMIGSVSDTGYTVKIICAWCGTGMGSKQGGIKFGEISHGICEKCEKNIA